MFVGRRADRDRAGGQPGDDAQRSAGHGGGADRIGRGGRDHPTTVGHRAPRRRGHRGRRRGGNPDHGECRGRVRPCCAGRASAERSRPGGGQRSPREPKGVDGWRRGGGSLQGPPDRRRTGRRVARLGHQDRRVRRVRVPLRDRSLAPGAALPHVGATREGDGGPGAQGDGYRRGGQVRHRRHRRRDPRQPGRARAHHARHDARSSARCRCRVRPDAPTAGRPGAGLRRGTVRARSVRQDARRPDRTAHARGG
mgnify:CR=1 FL=1